MSEADSSELSFRVGEAFLDDVGRGLARFDADDLRALRAVPGDVVLIRGRRATVARAAAAPATHVGRRLVIVDGLTRYSSQVGVDEWAAVRKVAFKPAESLLLAPVQAGVSTPTEAEVPHLVQLLSGIPVVLGDRMQVTFLGARPRAFTVEGAVPRGAVLVTPDTAIAFRPSDVSSERAYRVSYEDIGGLDREVALVREMVELPLRFPRLFDRLGIDPPRGVLLAGPPGTGKTLIARAVSSEVRAHFIHVNGPEVIHKFYGESEAKLREVFEEARKNAPSIVFLDEIDALAPRRAQVIGDVEKRVVAQLLALMDGLVERGEVVVIGATNMPELLDPALRRPGRFDREVTIGAPDRTARREILRIHSRRMPLAADVSLDQLAELTQGYVGADLAVLCKEAGMVAMRRLVAALGASAPPSAEPSTVARALPSDGDAWARVETLAAEVTRDDFLAAYRFVEPTSTREFLAEHPRVTFGDVGGLHEAKRSLRTIVELVRGSAAVAGHTRVNPPRGVLLTGASGTGKTLLVRAAAGEFGLTLITVEPSTLLSKWVGESEKGLHEVFKRAKQTSPCMLFFDEIEAMVPSRSRHEAASASLGLLSQLFRELDALHGSLGVTVLAATNRPDLLDPALLRAGRFDYVLELTPPDRPDRAEILRIHAAGLLLAADVDLGEVADVTAGWTGADLELLCKKAAILALDDLRRQATGPAADRTGPAADRFQVAGTHVREAQAQVAGMVDAARAARHRALT